MNSSSDIFHNSNVTIASDEHTDFKAESNPKNIIQVHVTNNRKTYRKPRNQKSIKSNNITIKRSNKIVQSLNLPVILNINPRSIYNKIIQFQTFIKEHDVDLICMSESWERESLQLNEIIQLEASKYKWQAEQDKHRM